MASRSRWMSPRCTSTSGMPSWRRAATESGTNEASWEEDLQESMDNCQRSGVGLSARGLDSCAAHQALPVSLLTEDVVNEQRLGQRTSLMFLAKAERIPTPLLIPSKPEGM